MNNFDDVVEKTKSMANMIGKKSMEALEISRQKVLLAEEKNNLNKAYAELGKLTYAKGNQVPVSEAQMMEATDEVAHRLETVNAIQQEIERLKNTKLCPQCGKGNPSTSTYCAGCGAKLDI